MSRLDRVIEAVKETRTSGRQWIYDDNGNIRDDVICGDCIPFLEELKEYEIGATDKFIEDFKKNTETHGMYTYNYNTNIDNDIRIWYRENCPVAIVNVHLYGDARIVFDTDFVVKMESENAFEEILYLESATQCIDINDQYTADVNLFSETYDVWDYVNEQDVGTYYAIEKADLLADIKKATEVAV